MEAVSWAPVVVWAWGVGGSAEGAGPGGGRAPVAIWVRGSADPAVGSGPGGGCDGGRRIAGSGGGPSLLDDPIISSAVARDPGREGRGCRDERSSTCSSPRSRRPRFVLGTPHGAAQAMGPVSPAASRARSPRSRGTG